jgi:hypothetical protein
MKIVVNFVPRMTIEEFAEKHDLTMEVHERREYDREYKRFYAHFRHCDIEQDGCYIGAFGNGLTPEDAIRDYTLKISLKDIVIEALTKNAVHIEVPRLKIC